MELYSLRGLLPGTLALAFVLAGIGPWLWSLSAAWERFPPLAAGLLLAVAVGAVGVPLALPWLPFRSFAVKGWLAGGVAALALTTVWPEGGSALAAGCLWAAAGASFLAMNFTGSTPFTSPTGVEREMRRHMPLQLAAAGLGLATLLVGPFL